MTRPTARGPLRVATFNVGLMSTFVRNWDRNKDYGGAVLEGLTNLFLTDHDAAVHGRRIARRLLDAPYDVVVLNELFHADARAALVEMLTDPGLAVGVRYPWVRGGFGAEERTPASGNPEPMPWDVVPDPGPFGDVDGAAVGALRALLDDSGLMVVSRLPLRPFVLDGTPTDWAFARYSASAGIDALCPKGAAAVVVQLPGQDVVVVFTHLQADDEDDAHRGVRRSQLAQLVWLARGVGEATNVRDVLVLGDLNVRGEVVSEVAGEQHLGEYDEVFDPEGVLGQLGEDGWSDGACAPGASAVPGRFDPQLSHPADAQRLDYVVPGRLDGLRGRSDRLLTVQHLMIAANLDDGVVSPESPIGLGPGDLAAARGHVYLSDHVGVNAIVGRGSPHSAPRVALDCTPPVDLTDPSPSADARFEGVRHGELRWLLLEPGAYRIAVLGHLDPAQPVDLEVYSPTDLSRPLADVMPEDPSPVDQRRGTRYPAVDHPLLVRLHSRTLAVDELGATVHRILGATPGDAVPLRPWTPTALMPWPTPAQGGRPDGARWFEVLLDPPDPGTVQAVTFRLHDDGRPLAGTFDVFPGTTIETPATALVDPEASLPPGVGVAVVGSSAGQRRFLVRVTPHPAQRDGQAVVQVESDLRWLVSASFVALDETGPDWSGADEISWTLTSDLHPPGALLHGSEDDVDTNEAFEMPIPGPLAFREHVTVVLRERAGAGADETATLVLPGEEPPDVVSRVTATLPDDVKDGTYGVDFTYSSVLRHR